MSRRTLLQSRGFDKVGASLKVLDHYERASAKHARSFTYSTLINALTQRTNVDEY
jgi:hypothetical protein